MKSVITHKDAILNTGSRSISQGMPPRTPESATPQVQGTVKEKKKGILKNVTRGKIPPATPSELRRPVGEITKPNDWKDLPAFRNRLIVNRA